MSTRIIFLMTLDYELFLGRNFFTPEETLFQPTEAILTLCARLDLPVTFFPDVCSVWAHRTSGLHDFADRFEGQIQEAIRVGHDVQLHLHPHWLYSTYENDEWRISTDRMYLYELGFGQGVDSSRDIVQKGKEYLIDLLTPICSDYRCIAFRGAGLALQPQEENLLSLLLEQDFKIDSSIAKGLQLKMDTVRIDYSNMPSSPNWFMHPSSGIGVSAKAGILEIPIGSFQLDLRRRIAFLFRRLGAVNELRGTGISRSSRQTRLANLYTLILENQRYILGNPWYVLSCDTKGFSLEMLLEGFDKYVQQHAGTETILVSMINHPKLLFTKQIRLLADFVKEIRQRYDITFATCAEAFDIHRELTGLSAHAHAEVDL